MNGYVSEDKGHSHSFDSNHQQLQLERGFLGRYSQLIHAFSFSLYLFSFSPIQDCLNGWDFVFLKKHKNTVSYNIHSLQKGFRLSLSLSLSLHWKLEWKEDINTQLSVFVFRITKQPQRNFIQQGRSSIIVYMEYGLPMRPQLFFFLKIHEATTNP